MMLHQDDQAVDRKTRRDQEDKRRMAFRRAIEAYSDERRVQSALDGYSEPSREQRYHAF